MNNIAFRSQNFEQLIYDHLLLCVRNETPTHVLKRFHQLFILNQYDDSSIREALNHVLMQSEVIENLLPFFNRCCYILVNRWQPNPQEREKISELINLIKQVQTPGSSNRYQRASKKLRKLIYVFSQSDHYSQLCRLAEFSKRGNRYAKEEPLVALIERYPYLYSHCLVNPNDDSQHQRLIQDVQQHTQKQFEQDLSRYIAMTAVAAERSQSKRLYIPSQSVEEPLNNPTLLTNKDLFSTLKHFTGASTQQGGYRESARSFIKVAKQQPTFGAFKEEMHRYIITDLNQGYVDCKFSQQLQQTLELVSPEQNQQPMSNVLMNRTFNQLLNFLVIESKRSPKHFVFMDLITNLGTTKTVGLLLKIVLLSQSVKSSLERRLSLLFNHYEHHQQGCVGWLVRCLEKVQLAFTSHFSRIDLSCLKTL